MIHLHFVYQCPVNEITFGSTISSLALGKCATYSTTGVYKGNVSNITCNYYCLCGRGIPYLLHLYVAISSYVEFTHITFCEGLPIVWFYC